MTKLQKVYCRHANFGMRVGKFALPLHKTFAVPKFFFVTDFVLLQVEEDNYEDKSSAGVKHEVLLVTLLLLLSFTEFSSVIDTFPFLIRQQQNFSDTTRFMKNCIFYS